MGLGLALDRPGAFPKEFDQHLIQARIQNVWNSMRIEIKVRIVHKFLIDILFLCLLMIVISMHHVNTATFPKEFDQLKL